MNSTNTSRTAHLLELMKKGDDAFNSRDVAAAGIMPKLVDTHQIDPRDWLRVIEVNLTGTFYLYAGGNRPLSQA